MSHFRSFGLHVGTSSDLERECVWVSHLYLYTEWQVNWAVLHLNIYLWCVEEQIMADFRKVYLYSDIL